jgi:hypothetical protein
MGVGAFGAPVGGVGGWVGGWVDVWRMRSRGLRCARNNTHKL